MADLEEIWLPLVDEPIGSIVQKIQEEDPEIDRLVRSPHRILAFRTFAYIRVGIASVAGVEGGALLATSLSEGVLRRVFAVFMLVTAAHIAWQNRRRR